MTESESIAYLTREGNLRVPGGRFGTDTYTCANVAYVVARIVAEANGEEITRDTLDHAMSLVVNSHDDVDSLILAHGTNADLDICAIADALLPAWEEEAEEMGRDAAEAHAHADVALRPDGEPNLSGEWADSPTPLSVAREVTERTDPPEWAVDAIADAWERGAQGRWAELVTDTDD